MTVGSHDREADDDCDDDDDDANDAKADELPIGM